MANTFTLQTDQARLDAIQFLERAARVNNGSARLVAHDEGLLVYVGVLFPRGLLDQTPTVLGLRVFALASPARFDVVVPLESLIHRLRVGLENKDEETTVPAPVASLSWSAVTPPQDGWRRRLSVPTAALQAAAAEGVSHVAKTVPEVVGESVLQKVRAEVWGANIAGYKRVPAGAAFAADALGFLTEKNLSVHSLDSWLRLSSKFGYVLVKFPGGTEFDDEEA
jgi:hypothetical protein